LDHLKTLNCLSFFEYNLQQSEGLSILPIAIAGIEEIVTFLPFETAMQKLLAG